jgi:hypothetical protein
MGYWVAFGRVMDGGTDDGILYVILVKGNSHSV